MLPLTTAQDLYYFIAAIAVLMVSGFLCWVLYELATLIHKANGAVDEATLKVHRIEKGVTAFVDKFSSISQYLGFIADGGKQLLGFMQRREGKSVAPKRGKGRSSHAEDEDLSDMP